MTKDTARLVLVVEDDVSVRRPLVKFLEMHGFAVVTAETSDEGLEQLRSTSARGRRRRSPVEARLGPRRRGADARRRAGHHLLGRAVGVGRARAAAAADAADREAVLAGAARGNARRDARPSPTHRIFIPSADSASSVPSCAVAFRTSSVGFTSTRSSEVSSRPNPRRSPSPCALRGSRARP